MKITLAIGALVALCQSALALKDGTYSIGSAALQSNKVLTDVGQNEELEFSEKSNNPYQTWFFTKKGGERDFVIQNLSGGYIDCGVEPGTHCVSGDDEEIYTVEQSIDGDYELVSKKTGYFLHAVDKGLQLAEWSPSPEQEFILTPI
ncbi:hypothetical protein ASPVEDRAFT_34082 [Aspergillus versicolor CBS 583.65]|uniref:Ricin B lectin domain-containing protein n=1 Tax=Aspergillus versicolor CBS 583.65 TaxID=1036611 RepID=A0A1L9Q2B3_ASPVE|nr:uncharacterized protein ASPVEDRAFT_34082 [Aspergillus versicolor CBS 583.65]OJJ07904.1 hypothetical protein ASPVEDRAFT_34082 [Aspergillus versicolor CBS 583.65]